MMGQAVGQQDRLFYEFNLEDRIPANHLLRRIDVVLDLSWLRAELSYCQKLCMGLSCGGAILAFSIDEFGRLE